MISGGDAAEQVVRLSLEGMEVAIRISGEGAKNLAVILAAALREEHKTKGKARLTNLIKSGKELKVFSVQNKDLKKFSAEAKRYGVLYCALKDRDDKSDHGAVDVIARAEDAPKIQRIIERFELASVDGDIMERVRKDFEARDSRAEEIPEKSKEDILLDDILSQPVKGETQNANPNIAKTEKSPLSEQNFRKEDRSEEGTAEKREKPSVREKLREYREMESDRRNGSEKGAKEKTAGMSAGKSQSKEKAR